MRMFRITEGLIKERNMVGKYNRVYLIKSFLNQRYINPFQLQMDKYLKKKLHYSEVLRKSNSRVKYGEQYETIDIFN